MKITKIRSSRHFRKIDSSCLPLLEVLFGILLRLVNFLSFRQFRRRVQSWKYLSRVRAVNSRRLKNRREAGLPKRRESAETWKFRNITKGKGQEYTAREGGNSNTAVPAHTNTMPFIIIISLQTLTFQEVEISLPLQTYMDWIADQRNELL